jgi:hypothetical protein
MLTPSFTPTQPPPQVNSSWRKVQSKLEAYPEYSELDKATALGIFDEHQKELERREKERRVKEEEERKRKERKNRDAMREMLKQHR